MNKRFFSLLAAFALCLTLIPTTAFADDEKRREDVSPCSCETACTTDNMNKECPVCGAENAIPQNCGQYIPVEDRTGENGSTERADDPNGPTELSAADQVQAMINALPSAEAITEENAEEVKAQLEAIDEAKEKLSDEEIDELDMTRYAEAAAALGALAAPMLLANDSPDEQFSLTPGGTYYFDLSGASIPGTVNTGNIFGATSLPDTTLHYVPFTYAGTVNAYKLTTEMATTEEYAQKNKYPHSLFVADYAVTHTISWNDLNTTGLIFGKNYASGGVDYTLRTPSAGSDCTGLDDSKRGVPQSNEWDTMLNKDSGYIQNWNGMSSWGQDVYSGGASYRATRGCNSARFWNWSDSSYRYATLGFRPVLEVLNADTLGSDGLKVVTLDLGGGTLGGSSEDIQIIVKSSESFAAPASDGLTRPDGDTGSYFMWLGSDGKFYAPGDSVPADVTKLTAQFALSEQFSLKPGGTYYFDLSSANIPGTANGSLPDSTLHYVPFTYAGTIEAYKLTSAMATTEEYAQQNKYPHSLFVADYAVTHTVSWNGLNDEGLIFGKNYASGGVDYTLRAPSVGSNSTGSGDSQRGVPQSNEWDTMLNKNSGYIKNWNGIYSWGQDTTRYNSSYRAYRGYDSARFWTWHVSSTRNAYLGFRPVLEILNPDTLGSDGLKVVTLDLGGGTLGNSSEDIQIIVKTGSEFTAPASDGLNRPAGDTGSYFMWLGSNGKLYAPGDSVPADVTKLTAQFALSEQFSLAPGGRYYFDLSAMNIPGTVNTGNIFGVTSLPDTTLHYVPFTYAGTVNAYKLTTEMATTEEYAQKNKYPHSLFVADYAVTNDVSWDALNTADLIFGKDYASGGVDYTLRAPSVGSNSTGSGDSQRGVPQSNEWDTMLNKNSGYIQNWNAMYSWGQDAYSTSYRASRGYNSARFWNWSDSSYRDANLGFRPVLEVLNSDTLGSGGLKVVTLDLGGGKLGVSSDAIQIIVKNGSEFTAPASDGLTRPDGNTGSYFMWLDGNGKSYEPGDSVPADVTELTVQWTAPTYTVTLHANGGTINNGNVTSYTYGVGATLPTADDMTYTGHTFKGWYDNESLTGSPVTAIGGTEMGNKEYWAKWEINQYTITYDLAGGTVEGNPDTYTVEMDTFTLKNPTRPGYTFTGWSGTGLDGENNMTVTIPKGSTGERRYTAHWRYNGGSSGGSSSYPITVPSKTENGTVTVSPKNASAGSTVTITVKLDSGYVLETISVTDKNGKELKLTDKGNGKYTFTMPASKVEIKVTFMEDNSVLNFFYDVPNDAYYYEAVKWAAENGITGGVGNSLFAPNQPCTRAQIVTFLWRAAGSPVVNYLMPFTDVDEGAYYAEAVRWAASTGIVTGLTETTFGTDSVCTRAQAAAMIYRCAQAQGKGFTGAWMFHLPFTDVPEWAYESVAWCYMNGVTTGVNETAFAPGNDCTRAQIVTFLWRAFGK